MVLIVEDEPTIRDVWTRSMTTLGYEVITAEDANEAMRLLDRTPLVTVCDRALTWRKWIVVVRPTPIERREIRRWWFRPPQRDGARSFVRGTE